MGSEAVPSHEAALEAAQFSHSECMAAAADVAGCNIAPLEDYLFCHELLGAEALDLCSPLPAWDCLHPLGSGYGHHSPWSSSPPWTSSFTAATSSFTSHSCSPPHDLQIKCLQHDPHDDLNSCFPPRSCSKLSIATPSTGLNEPIACMHASSFPGELGPGSCTHVNHQRLEDSLQASADDHCESMCVLLERQQWPHCRPLQGYAESMHQYSSLANCMCIPAKGRPTRADSGAWPMCRRRAVQRMLEAAKTMRMSLSSIAQAVAYFDRYLSHHIKESCHVSADHDVHLAGVACLWIALKMEHSNAPDAAFIIQSLAMYQYSREEGITSLKAMEANILLVLQWRLLGVSMVEFVDSIISSLRSASTYFPKHLLQPLQSRAHEIVQGTFLEVAFAGFEACVVGVCAIQHAMEEIWPSQAASIMHSIHKIVSPIDMAERSKCYKAMGDLVVDPLNNQLITSSPISHVFQCSHV